MQIQWYSIVIQPAHCVRAMIILMIMGIIASCQPYDSRVNVIINTQENNDCTPYMATNAITCTRDGTTLMIQTAFNNTQLSHNNLEINFTGTLQITMIDDRITISNLRGSILVSLAGETQLIPVGGTINLEWDGDTYTLNDRRIFPLYPDDIAQNLLLALPQAITIPEAVALPEGYTSPPTSTPTTRPLSATELAIGTFTPEPTVCSPREDWYSHHTVQRGDTLGRLAQQYDTSLSALQSGNCLQDINRLQIGQRLRVPGNATVAPATGASPTPSAVFFRADALIIASGTCTILRWDVLNIQAVYLNDELTTPQNILEVCPAQTSQFVLRVVYPDDRESEHIIEITVTNTP